MRRPIALSLLIVSLCLAGCDSKKSPDEGHINVKAQAGVVAAVPYASVSLEIKGLDIIAAKAIDWVKGIITYVLGNEEQRLELTAEQLNALKQGESATGELPDGTAFSLTPKK